MNWLVHLGVVKEYEQADRDKEYVARDAKQKAASPALLKRFKEVG